MSDDDLMLDTPLDSAQMPSRVEVASQALTLLLQGSIPRLVLLLAWLGHNDQARQLLALQANILGVLTTPQKRKLRQSA